MKSDQDGDACTADASVTATELAQLRAGHDRIARVLAELKYELAWLRFVRKYSPDQPRVPAGSREGGQWTDGQGGQSAQESAGQVALEEMIGAALRKAD